MDLNGKIFEMKISTEIGDGSWPDRDGRELVSSFQEDFFREVFEGSYWERSYWERSYWKRSLREILELRGL